MDPAALEAHLVKTASHRYLSAGGYAYHFARGKLRSDPVFTVRGLAVAATNLDVLQYMDNQMLVLSRARESLDTRGTLILCIGDASAGLPFADVLLIAKAR